MKRTAFLLLVLLCGTIVRGEADKYEIYAVRYATLAHFPLSGLVAGADRERRLDIAMMIWVLKGADGRVAIVDSGFHRDRYFHQFTVRDFVKPSDVIAPLGLKPGDVTDIFLTHMHWDHAGGIDLFPSARVWIQKDEYDYYTGAAWQSPNTHGGIDADDVLEIVRRNIEGKVSFVRGDDETSLSGIAFGIGGRHTWRRSSSRRRRGAAAPSSSPQTTCTCTRISTRTNRSRRRSTRHRICGRRTGCEASRAIRSWSSQDTIPPCSTGFRR